jgi:hypothetical protein
VKEAQASMEFLMQLRSGKNSKELEKTSKKMEKHGKGFRINRKVGGRA